MEFIEQLRKEGEGMDPVAAAADAKLQAIDDLAKAAFDKINKRPAKSNYDKKSRVKKLKKLIKRYPGTATAALAEEQIATLEAELK